MADAPASSADAPAPAAKRRGISFKTETEGWEDVLKEEAQLEQPAGADGATPQRQRQLKQAINKVVKVQRTQSAMKGGDGAGLKPVPLTGATWKEMQDAMAKDQEDTFGKHEHHDGIIQRGLKLAADTFFGVHREEEDDEDNGREFTSMRQSQNEVRALVMLQIREGENNSELVRAYYRQFKVHPSAPWLFRWMLFMSGLLLYNTVCIPLRLIFILPDGTARYKPGEPIDNSLGSAEAYPAWQALDLIVDSFFLADILLHFRLGFYARSSSGAPPRCVMDGTTIACRYLRFWFWLDSVAIFPWQLLAGTGDAGHTAVLVRNLRLVRLLRLFRMMQIRSFFQNWDSAGINAFKHPVLQRLLKQFVIMITSSHLIACGAYCIAWAQGFTDQTWVGSANNDVGDEWWEQYMAAMYWTVMTLTTVGYGDIGMISFAERMYASLIMLIGAIFFAFMLSNIAELVREIDAASTMVRRRMDSVNGYMRYRSFPLQLQTRIRKYYSFYWSRQSIFDETTIMKTLPTHLRREVSLYLHREMISKVPFFNDADTSFISSLVQALAPLCAAPQDFIITVGEIVTEMFFVDFGEVEVWNAGMVTLYRTARSGGFFGEVGLLSREPSTCNCRSVTYVELWSLARDDLSKLTKDSPKMGKKIEQCARARLAAELSHEIAARSGCSTRALDVSVGAMQGKANWKLAGAFQGVQSPSEGGGGCASALLAAAKAAKEDSFSKKDGEGDAHDEVEELPPVDDTSSLVTPLGGRKGSLSDQARSLSGDTARTESKAQAAEGKAAAADARVMQMADGEAPPPPPMLDASKRQSTGSLSVKSLVRATSAPRGLYEVTESPVSPTKRSTGSLFGRGSSALRASRVSPQPGADGEDLGSAAKKVSVLSRLSRAGTSGRSSEPAPAGAQSRGVLGTERHSEDDDEEGHDVLDTMKRALLKIHAKNSVAAENGAEDSGDDNSFPNGNGGSPFVNRSGGGGGSLTRQNSGAEQALYDARLHRVESKLDQVMSSVGDLLAAMKVQQQQLQQQQQQQQSLMPQPVGVPGVEPSPGSTGSPGVTPGSQRRGSVLTSFSKAIGGSSKNLGVE